MKSPYLLCIALLIGLSGCRPDYVLEVTKQSVDEDTIWVFAHINVPEDEEIESYYYYGRINRPLYEQMIDGTRSKGFILFRDMRYWSGETLVQYEDETDTGSVVFRIEHIVKIDLEKGDPWILENSSDSTEET